MRTQTNKKFRLLMLSTPSTAAFCQVLWVAVLKSKRL